MVRTIISALLTILPLTLAQSTQTILVGKGADVFVPETLTAPVGSKVDFLFAGAGHAVTQSTFGNPCHPESDSSFYTGDLNIVSIP